MNILPRETEKRRHRACLLCSLVKSEQQFIEDGCDNCDQVLDLKGDPDKVKACTSANFDGVLGLIKPGGWVSKWQRIDKFTPGVYAIRVSNMLPAHIEEELLDKGIKYRPRDGSIQD
jgi:transcription elongation factor SPT4